MIDPDGARLRLRYRLRAQVADALAHDPFTGHKYVMSAFRDGVGAAPREQLAVLWRLDGEVLTVRAREAPRFPLNEAELEELHEDAGPELQIGSTLALQVLLCAQTNTLSGPTFLPADARAQQEHQPIPASRRLRWAQDRLAKAGFVFVVEPLHKVRDVKVPGRHLLPGIELQGTAIVTDAQAAADAWRTGVGRGKAYGFGMVAADGHRAIDESAFPHRTK